MKKKGMYKRWETLSKCYIYKNMSHTFSLSDRKCFFSERLFQFFICHRIHNRKDHLPKNLHFSESVLLNSRMPRHSCCEVRVMQLHDILLLRTSAILPEAISDFHQIFLRNFRNISIFWHKAFTILHYNELINWRRR